MLHGFLKQQRTSKTKRSDQDMHNFKNYCLQTCIRDERTV